jgi:repressor LexA
MEFHERLNLAIRESGITNKRLSEMLNDDYNIVISKESIGKYRNGQRTPSPAFIKAVTEITRVSGNYLLGYDTKEVKQIPIVGSASCGNSEYDVFQDSSMKANYNGEYWNKDLYCVIASGDSMASEIEDGDEIICDPNVSIQNGDIVHYQINGESAIKIYNKDEHNHLIELIPYNSTNNFKTRVIRLESDELNDLKIAKVVAINKLKFNNRTARLKQVGR